MKISSIMFLCLMVGAINWTSLNDLQEDKGLSIYVFFRFIILSLSILYITFNFKLVTRLISSSSFFRLVALFASIRILQSFTAPDMLLSLFKSIEFFAYTITFTIVCFKRRNNISSLLALLLTTYIIAVSVSVISAILFPDVGLRTLGSIPQIQGVFPTWNSNGLAQVCSLLVLVTIYLKKDLSSMYRISVILFLITVIFFCQTRSVLLPFVMLIVIYFWRNTTDYRIKFFYMFLLVISSILAFVSVAELWDYMSRGQNMETMINLSGRLISWAYTYDYLIENPSVLLYGLGPYTGYKDILGPEAFILLKQTIAEHTLDNAYLELIVNSGLLGFIVFCFVIIKLHIILKSIVNRRERIITQSILYLILIRSVFVSSLLIQSSLIFIFLLSYGSVLSLTRHGAEYKKCAT